MTDNSVDTLLDTFTLNHLAAWAKRKHGDEHVARNVARGMAAFLRSVETEDREEAERLLNRGWPEVESITEANGRISWPCLACPCAETGRTERGWRMHDGLCGACYSAASERMA